MFIVSSAWGPLTNLHRLRAITSDYGKNIAPRIAAKLDVAQISDITAVD